MACAEQQTIIVSGGSRGLGQAICQYLINNNYCIATFSRSETDFIKTMQEKFHENFYWQMVDADDHKGLTSFVDQVNQRYGRLDGLINNAGIAKDGILSFLSDEDIHQTISVNLESTILLSKYCLRYLLRTKGGAIINISSIIGLRGYTGLTAYSATKAGVDGFTRALAREVAPRKIRVNSIAPGYLDTEMSDKLTVEQKQQIIRRTPLGRLGTTDDIVGVIGFLLSDAARFITGQTIVIDGGLTN